MQPDPEIKPGADRRIRAAAAHAGLTLVQLSERVRTANPGLRGVGAANIKQLGTTLAPRVEHLRAIAEATGMPAWYLIGGVDALAAVDRPDALTTVPAKTLAEVRELRALVERLLERYDAAAQ